jgi:uncharacterized RDD family membrane protein YckC
MKITLKKKNFYDLIKKENKFMNKLLSIGIKRLIAAIIDYGIFFAIFVGYTIFFGIRKDDGIFEVKGFSHIFLILILWLTYFPIIESKLGYTLGKGLFDLKVVNIKNQKPSFSQSLKRHLLDFVDVVFYGFIMVVSIRQTKEFKRLGDLWAKTLVVSDD